MATISTAQQYEQLDRERVDQMETDFNSNRSNRLMQNSITQFDVDEIALDRSVITGATHKFSHVIDD